MNKLLNRTKWLAQRTPFTYLILTLLCLVVINRDVVRHGITTRQINNLIPVSYEVLFKITNPSFPQNDRALRRYIRYYKKITGFRPQMADAHGMLGYCYYYQGKEPQAISSFERAYALRPDVFWFSYNLGVIYLKQQNLKQSLFYFKKALAADPNRSLIFVKTSRMIYADILSKSRIKDEYLVSQLQRGRVNLLMLIKAMQNRESPDPLIRNFNVQMF